MTPGLYLLVWACCLVRCGHARTPGNWVKFAGILLCPLCPEFVLLCRYSNTHPTPSKPLYTPSSRMCGVTIPEHQSNDVPCPAAAEAAPWTVAGRTSRLLSRPDPSHFLPSSSGSSWNTAVLTGVVPPDPLASIPGRSAHGRRSGPGTATPTFFLTIPQRTS